MTKEEKQKMPEESLSDQVSKLQHDNRRLEEELTLRMLQDEPWFRQQVLIHMNRIANALEASLEGSEEPKK